jgi:hypothetical protein
LLSIAAVICALTLSSGNDDANVTPPTAISNLGVPSVTISQPTNAQSFRAGQTITVQAQATDPGTGVTRVELLVNNVVVDSQTSQSPTGEKNLSVLLDYVAAVPVQNLVLTVRPYASRNTGVVKGTDATVTINVTDASGNTGNNTTGNNTTGNNTSGNNTVAVPPTQAPFNPTCRARVDTTTLNLRQGPGTDFSIVAVLNLGAEVPLVGRLGDNSWWQVTSGANRGWVSAAYTTLLGNCNNVAVSAPPASPTAAITPTPTGPQPANLLVSVLTGPKNIVLTGGEVAASYIISVRNSGGTNAGAFNVTITKPNGQTVDYSIAGLNAGQELQIPDPTFTNATFTTPGTYRLTVFVDSSGNITETNKTDNVLSLDIVVVSPTPTPEGQ